MKRYGSVLLVRPVSHTLLMWAFLGFALAIGAFFATFEYQRKVAVAGSLAPKAGLVKIVAPVSGTVVEHKVTEGQVVKAGDILFVVDNERESRFSREVSKSNAERVAQRRDNLQSDQLQAQRQADQKMSAVRKKASDIQVDIGKLESQLSLQRQRIEIEEGAYLQATELQTKGFISTAQLRTKKAEMLDQRQRLADIERAKSSAQRELQDLQAASLEIRIQAERDQAAIERGISSTEQELADSENRRDTVIRAPMDGIVSAIAPVLGQAISANSPLAVLLPANSGLVADLLVPSKAIGFVKPGMTVLIRYQAFPYQKFGIAKGTIEEVSDSTVLEMSGALGVPPDQTHEPLYRVRTTLPAQTIQAYGTQRQLKPGMLLEASILTEKRHLYEWVLEPLYSITGRV